MPPKIKTYNQYQKSLLSCKPVKKILGENYQLNNHNITELNKIFNEYKQNLSSLMDWRETIAYFIIYDLSYCVQRLKRMKKSKTAVTTLKYSFLRYGKKQGCIKYEEMVNKNSSAHKGNFYIYKNKNMLLKKFYETHGGLYNYDNVEYGGTKIKVSIKCKKHGTFQQLPFDHINGAGCPQCGNTIRSDKNRISLVDWLQRAKIKHGDRYDYSMITDVKSQSTKLPFICKKHGVFYTSMKQHLKFGGSCPSCTKSFYENEWLDSLNISKQNRNIKVFLDDGYIIADGYNEKTKTVYEFWGDYWHGNPLTTDHKKINYQTKKTFGELYANTQNKIHNIKKSGYILIDIWEYEWLKLRDNV